MVRRRLRVELPWTPVEASLRAEEAAASWPDHHHAHLREWLEFGKKVFAGTVLAALVGGKDLIGFAGSNYAMTVAVLLLLGIVATGAGLVLLSSLAPGRPGGAMVLLEGRSYKAELERSIERSSRWLSVSVALFLFASLMLIAALAIAWISGLAAAGATVEGPS